MHSLYFSYDGITSESMGIYSVKLDGGIHEQPFLGGKDVASELIMGNDIPYRYGERTSPLTFRFALSPLGGLWTEDKRREVAAWLDNGRYAEFYSTDNIDKRYFLKLTGSSGLHTNGLKQGYITVEFENISCYAYSAEYELIWTASELAENPAPSFANLGNVDLYPQLWIKKLGDGSFAIRNLTNGGTLFRFNHLMDDEIVHVLNDSRHISSSLSELYRYDDFNGNYLRLLPGRNTLQIEGDAELKFRYRYIFKG